MVNDDVTGNEQIEEVKLDDIDTLIQNTIIDKQLTLVCPNKNDKSNCDSMMRLAKILITCKKWFDTIDDDPENPMNIEKNIKHDVGKFVNTETFKNVVSDCVKSIQLITEKQMHILVDKLQKNMDSLFINTSKSPRKEFVKLVRQHTKLKASQAGKLYYKIRDSLKDIALKFQFSEFLSSFNINLINQDYHHILKVHLNSGNKNTIENTFRFFELIVHYEDKPSEIENCKSLKRRRQRTTELNSGIEEKTIDNTDKNEKNKNIWELKRYYMHAKLDIIHSHLVHSQKKSTDEKIQNKDKYITRLSKSNTGTYGFGVEHSYPYLSPKYPSVRDELLSNKLHPVKNDIFRTTLVKAINMHDIVLGDEYKNELICKHFQQQYNIIRN
eukprot:284486_1